MLAATFLFVLLLLLPLILLFLVYRFESSGVLLERILQMQLNRLERVLLKSGVLQDKIQMRQLLVRQRLLGFGSVDIELGSRCFWGGSRWRLLDMMQGLLESIEAVDAPFLSLLFLNLKC